MPDLNPQRLLTACMTAAALCLASLAANAAPLEKIVLQLKWSHQFQFAGYYAAKAQGYYAEEGLEVDIRALDPNTVVVDQVSSGAAHYGVGDAGILAAYANGTPIVALAAIFQHSPLVLVSRSASGIISPYELRGKRIMLDAKNFDEAPLISMLASAGLTRDDYTVVPHTYDEQDLVDGRVDAMSAYLTDSVYLLRQQGVSINIVNPQSYGLDFYGDLLFTSVQELEAHPERAERFVRASLKGWRYAMEHPEEIIALILSTYPAQMNVEHLRFEAEEMHKLMTPGNVPLGQIQINRLRRVATTYAEQKIAPPLSDRQLQQFVFETRRSTELNAAERAWLKQHPVIRVGIDRDFPPYEFVTKNKEFIGINADILALLETELGVRFEVIKDKTWQETLDMARAGEIDMLSDAVDTPERRDYLMFTAPFLESPIVIINDGRNGYIGDIRRLYGKRVAIKQGYFMQEVLARDHPRIEQVSAPDELSAFELLKSGAVTAYIGDAPSVNNLIQQTGELTLRYSGPTEYTSAHSMAVIHAHPELLSILEKTLLTIPKSQIDDILNRWMSVRIESGVSSRTALLYGAAALALLFLLAVWVQKLRREVHARQHAEAELTRYRDHLEALVEARTADLSIAKEAAEAASKAKSTFLANMSHELRTPMNGIMGMIDLVARRSDDPRQKAQLDKAQKASRHLLQIINDILDISKIEADRLTLEHHPFVLNDVIRTLTTVLNHKVETKKLQLRIELDPALGETPLMGDPLRLGQVLLNLTDNAIKFTAEGEIVVRLRIAEEDAQALVLKVKITDNGIGISEEAKARLFSPFEQSDSSTTRQYGGTGLGLAISKRLVNLMGGEIGIANNPLQGSTFWFTVCLTRAEAAPEPTVDTEACAEQRLRDQHAGKRILLVEDEPLNRHVANAILKRNGLLVDQAEDGQAAVNLANRARYDLILMDIQMPVMNGLDATRSIRAEGPNRATPIVALTANAFAEDRRRCLEAGMNDHLAKPIEVERLCATLIAYLDPPSD
ncbi:MAG: ABC transporter substrate-binding protein [Rhodocyclaceae bacterium]|nr:ABC transporter substrate-binding protein [Rhodocyclaceae bacterium]